MFQMKLAFCICIAALWCGAVRAVVLRNIAKRQICSSGGCSTCDGVRCTSCNSNDVCCPSVSCNSCVSQCAAECNTARCKNNCVTGCTSSCSSSTCDVQSCTPCVNKCSVECPTKQCVDTCAGKCDKCKPEENPVVIIPSSDSPGVVVNNTNNNLINLTTHIDIQNTVHNINNISIPIVVNSTNINNINLSSDVAPPPPPAPPTDNCCYVLHPKQCYTDEVNERRCVVRRTRECSDECISPVVAIERTNTVNTGCQYVRSWPYAYCGGYARRDCSQCYTCEGTYNPGECFTRSSCSNTCRVAAPSCFQTQRGLACY